MNEPPPYETPDTKRINDVVRAVVNAKDAAIIRLKQEIGSLHRQIEELEGLLQKAGKE